MSRKRKNKDKKKQKDHGASPGPVAEAARPISVDANAAGVDDEGLSARGIKTIAGGVGLLVIGFYILTLTDPNGRNWASTLSPILILGAYVVIGFGIFLDDPEDGEGGGSDS